MSRHIHLPLLAAAGIAALTLVGCSGIVPNVQEIAQNAIQEVAENATGGAVDIDAGPGAELPAGWPGLPTPDGQLTSTLAAEGIFALTYLVADDAAVQALKAELMAGGFELTLESTGDFNVATLADADWVVSLAWVEDGTGQGMILNYGATPTPTS